MLGSQSDATLLDGRRTPTIAVKTGPAAEFESCRLRCGVDHKLWRELRLSSGTQRTSTLRFCLRNTSEGGLGGLRSVFMSSGCRVHKGWSSNRLNASAGAARMYLGTVRYVAHRCRLGLHRGGYILQRAHASSTPLAPHPYACASLFYYAS